MKAPDISQAVKASGGVGGATISAVLIVYASLVQPAVNSIQYELSATKEQVSALRSTVSDLDRSLMMMSMTCGRPAPARGLSESLLEMPLEVLGWDDVPELYGYSDPDEE